MKNYNVCTQAHTLAQQDAVCKIPGISVLHQLNRSCFSAPKCETYCI